jgi:hypothetical protein
MSTFEYLIVVCVVLQDINKDANVSHLTPHYPVSVLAYTVMVIGHATLP